MFSAVAYFFARDLHRSLGVPVGIVLSAWPGTAGEEWTDPESLRREPVLQPLVERSDASAEIALEFDEFEILLATGDASGDYAPKDNVYVINKQVKTKNSKALH